MCLESDWQGCHKTVQTGCVCVRVCVPAHALTHMHVCTHTAYTQMH